MSERLGERRKLLNIRALWNEELRPDAYWVEKGLLLKGTALLLGGEAKIGKTFIVNQFARDLANAEPLWGIERFAIPKPARSLIIDMELNPYEYHRRVKLHPAEPPDGMFYAPMRGKFEFDHPSAVPLISDLVKRYEIDVVFVDPVSQAIEGADSNNDTVKKIWENMARIQDKTHEDLAYVVTHHFGKPPRSKDDREMHDPLDAYNFRGASKWKDNPDSLVCFSKTNKHKGEWMRNNFRIVLRGGRPIDDTLTISVYGDDEIDMGGLTRVPACQRTGRALFQPGD